MQNSDFLKARTGQPSVIKIMNVTGCGWSHLSIMYGIWNNISLRQHYTQVSKSTRHHCDMTETLLKMT